MHRAQNYFDCHINAAQPALVPSNITLNPVHASNIKRELEIDAKSYAYSSIVSIADALQGMQHSFFSWSAVKLYYALFYALRAALAAENYALLYYTAGQKKTPYLLECSPGCNPEKKSGNTHKVVLDIYEALHPASPMVTQLIEHKKPFNWLMERREEANYKNGRFPDPAAPKIFAKIATTKLRQNIAAYIEDGANQYAYDPDHAVVALPVAAAILVRKMFKQSNPPIQLDQGEIDYLASIFRDKHGVINNARAMLE